MQACPCHEIRLVCIGAQLISSCRCSLQKVRLWVLDLQAIERHFTEAFISSLNTDLKAPDRDVSKLDSSATAGELSFCREEKAYMMKCH